MSETTPETPIVQPPIFVWPPRPIAALKYLGGIPGYFVPLNFLYMGLAIITWFVLTPDLVRMASLEWDWIALVYARNLGFTFLVYGGLHLWFYTFKCQGTQYMLNRQEPTASDPRYLFGNQVRENMFWTAISGVGIWSTYEIITLWAFANGFMPMLNFDTHPVYFVLLFCAIPIIRDAHFYFVHRLLHCHFLYKRIHALHHKNMNVGPWSGMSMHPVEHIFYFSGVILYWLALSHPLHAIFHLQQTGLAPALAHCGFHKLKSRNGNEYSIGPRYFHYLHHRYFECNYSGDGTVPLDKCFGTWHDGTPEGHTVMRERRLRAHGS